MSPPGWEVKVRAGVLSSSCGAAMVPDLFRDEGVLDADCPHR
jgi:hypothetical protein